MELHDLTVINGHGDVYELAARALSCTELADRFTSINRLQQELGHLPQKEYEERHTLHQKLLDVARASMSQVDYAQFYDQI